MAAIGPLGHLIINSAVKWLICLTALIVQLKNYLQVNALLIHGSVS